MTLEGQRKTIGTISELIIVSSIKYTVIGHLLATGGMTRGIISDLKTKPSIVYTVIGHSLYSGPGCDSIAAGAFCYT